MILTDVEKVLRSPVRIIPRSGLVRMSGGRLIQSRGRKEYICGLIREKGKVNLCLKEDFISWGRGILTRL